MSRRREESCQGAPDVRVVYRVLGPALLDQRGEPGLVGKSARELHADVDHAARCRGVTGIGRDVWPARIDLVAGPDPGEIGLAICGPRCSGGHVDGAVRLARRSRTGVANPLRGQRTGRDHAGEYDDEDRASEKKQDMHLFERELCM